MIRKIPTISLNAIHNSIPSLRTRFGVRKGAGLLALAFSLAFLYLSDPSPILLVHQPPERPWPAFNLENTFAFSPAPPELFVIARSPFHPNLRLRMNPCPIEALHCKPGDFFFLRLEKDQQKALHFASPSKQLLIEVQRVPLHPLFLAFLACLLLAILLLLEGEARMAGLMTALSGGLYLSVTQGLHRAMDLSGHLEHVAEIARRGPLVNANLCWECFQPPLYYFFSSMVLGFSENLPPASSTFLQGLSLLYHIASAPLIAESLRPFASTRKDLLIYTSLTLLWPGAILASVRVGNDSALYLVSFLILFCISRKKWELAALFAAIGLFVKKNAVVLVAVLGVFGFCFLIRRRMSFSRPVLILFILLLGLIGSASLDRIKSFDPKRMEVLANQLKVSNEVSHLFVPEPGAFLREPFLNPWSKGPNLDHLPNYFWKSSLFGEWSFEFPASDKLAIVISGILLVLLAISGIAWLKTPSALPFLLILNSFGAIASYRFLYPFSCNGDFRFVYPYVVFGIALTLAQAKGSLLKRLARWVSLFFLLVFQVFLLFFWIGEIG